MVCFSEVKQFSQAEYYGNLPMLLEHGDQMLYEFLLRSKGLSRGALTTEELNKGTAFMNALWARGLAGFFPAISPVLCANATLLSTLSTKDENFGETLFPDDKHFRSVVLSYSSDGRTRTQPVLDSDRQLRLQDRR